MRVLVAASLSGLLIACSSAPVRPATPVSRVDCGVSIPGLDPVLKRTRFLIFGEIHGSEEIPAFFAQAVCQASASGERVRVGLELPTTEQPRIDEYLESASAETAPLTAGPFWTSEYQDGRRSRAMLALIKRLRELKAAGRRVEIVAFDPAPPSGDRDAYLAESLALQRERDPAARFLVLTGNLHARRDVGTRRDVEHSFMAHRLAALEPSLMTLNVVYPAGTAWTCTGSTPESCGEHSIGSRTIDPPAGITLDMPNDKHGYDGTFAVAALHASPPASRGEVSAPSR